MTGFYIIRCGLQDEVFKQFHEIIPGLYPEVLWPVKQTEGINQDFFYCAYLVKQQEKIVARCCLYNNPYMTWQEQKACCFGNYESHDLPGLSGFLLNELSNDARKLGAAYLIGPMNGSTWDTYRLTLPSAAPGFFPEPTYPAYYFKQFTDAGFSPMGRYVSHIDRSPDIDEQRTKNAEMRFEREGIRFRELNLACYEAELEKLYRLCMESFSNNFLFTPISKQAFYEKYLKIKPFIKPEYVTLAEDKQGDLVGFIFCVDNHTDKKEKGLIVKTVAKKPGIKYGGMAQILANSIKSKALSKGYRYLIHAFMIETNMSRRVSERFNGQCFREYFLFSKTL